MIARVGQAVKLLGVVVLVGIVGLGGLAAALPVGAAPEEGAISGRSWQLGGNDLEWDTRPVISVFQANGLTEVASVVSGNEDYTIAVPPGSYKVRFSPADGPFHPTWWGDVTTPADSPVVTVGPGEHVTGITGYPRYKASISGHVTLTNNAPLADAGEIDVYAYPEAGTVAEIATGATYYDDGAYTVAGLDPGTYSIQMRSSDPRWNASATGPITVVGENDQLTGHDIGLSSDQVSLTGAVTGPGPDSAPVPALGVEVTLYYDETDYYPAEHGQQMTTGPDGRYTFVGLPEGVYEVKVTDPEGRWKEQWYNNAADRQSDTKIPVGWEGAATANMTLEAVAPTPEPTVTPTPTPEPTVTPTATPMPTATPTSIPTPEPTSAPGPTVAPTSSPAPAMTPTPEPTSTTHPVSSPPSAGDKGGDTDLAATGLTTTSPLAAAIAFVILGAGALTSRRRRQNRTK